MSRQGAHSVRAEIFTEGNKGNEESPGNPLFLGSLCPIYFGYVGKKKTPTHVGVCEII